MSPTRPYLKPASALALCLFCMASLFGCLSDGKNSAYPETTGLPRAAGTNSAPRITGIPASAVKVGTSYSFTPVASDANGDTLRFEIQNKPFWAAFNQVTGEISGTAPSGSEGSYENISIVVSDGQASTALEAFAVTVVQDAPGSITLNWQPPAANDDGTPLLDLGGYRIYYGRESGKYDNVIDIENPGVTTYLIEGLVPGRYFIAATSYTKGNVESDFSNELQAVAE